MVNSHPIQYFAPLYAYLNDFDDIEVTALYCSDFSLRGAVDPGFREAVTWNVDLLSGYRSVFLGKRWKERSPRGFWSLICPELCVEIRRDRYDAVLVHGNQFAAYVLAVVVAKVKGIPVLNRCDTILALSRSRPRRWIRDAILGQYYKLLDGFMANGTANREYYRHLGVPDHRIFVAPYAVDNTRFKEAARIDSAEKEAIRQRYNLPGKTPVVLYASKFMQRKHPDDLLRATSILRKEGLDFHVLMVGGGEMEAKLKALTRELGLDNVRYGGFVNQAELPKVFSATDIFVLPAENEPWALIVNEVMCAGRPVIVGNEIGCAADLVKDGVNGRLVRARDPEGLAAAIREILVDEKLRTRMGAESLKIIDKWDFRACRRGFEDAVQSLASKAA